MKKAQTLAISFGVIMVILALAIPLFLNEYKNMQEPEHNYEDLTTDAQLLANQLLANPTPISWTADSVRRIGLLNNGTLERFHLLSFSSLEYEKSKILLGIRSDYIFFITDRDKYAKVETILPPKVNISYWGYSAFPHDRSDIQNGGLISQINSTLADIFSNSTDLVKTEKFVRFRVDNDTATAKITIYVWQS